MRHEPESLPRHVLTAVLDQHWRLNVQDLTYSPLGFGSHHWVASCADGSKRWITADNLVGLSTQDGDSVEEHFQGLRDAFETACRLRDGGLEFVLPPERTTSGEVLIGAGEEWSVAVFPFVDAVPMGPGPWDGVAGATEAARLVGRLHRAIPPPSLGRWSETIPLRHELSKALSATEESWITGPFGDGTRQLLGRNRDRLAGALQDYDRLATLVLASPEAWVVTHGEPHSANFLGTADGRILLIDWDTVRLAPRERDIELGEGHAFEAYQEAAGAPAPRPEAMELFRLRWSLADICVYVSLFFHEHGRTEDEAESWHHLNAELQRLFAG